MSQYADPILMAVGRLEGRLVQLDEMRATLTAIQEQLREGGKAQVDLDRRLGRLEQIYEEYQERSPDIRAEFARQTQQVVRDEVAQVRDQLDQRIRPFERILSNGKAMWIAGAAIITVVGVPNLVSFARIVVGLFDTIPH